MKPESRRPAFSKKRFIEGQLELEQQFLLLSDTQRGILSIALSGRALTNATYLRLLYYAQRLAAGARDAGSLLARPAARCFSFLLPGEGARARKEAKARRLLSGLERMDARYQGPFIAHIREKSSAAVEQEIRRAARDLDLPSNKKFEKELDALVEKGYLEAVVASEPRRTVAYTVNAAFLREWERVRTHLLEAIRRGQIKKQWLSPFSRRFWRIE